MLSNMRYYTIVNLTLKTTDEKLVLLCIPSCKHQQVLRGDEPGKLLEPHGFSGGLQVLHHLLLHRRTLTFRVSCSHGLQGVGGGLASKAAKGAG